MHKRAWMVSWGALAALGVATAFAAACAGDPEDEPAPADSGPEVEPTDGGPPPDGKPVDGSDDADGAAPKGTADLQFLTISDWHGQLDPLSETDATTKVAKAYGGVGVLKAYFDGERKKNANTWLLTAGDEFGATPAVSSASDDKPAVDSMNFLGLYADTFGNHNFDRGTAFLKDRMAESKYLWISSNLTNAAIELDGPTKKVTTPFHVFEVKGTDGSIKVALLGITNPDAPSLVVPGAMGTLKVEDPVATTTKVAKDARAAGADVVIALVHMGATGKDGGGAATGPLVDYALGIKGVDLIVGDHTDQVVNANIGGALVVENRSKGRTYGRITVKVDKGTVTSKTAEIVDPLGRSSWAVPPETLSGTTCSTSAPCPTATPAWTCNAGKCERPATCPTVACPTGLTCASDGKSCTADGITPDAAAETMLKPYRDAVATKFDAKIGKTTGLFPRDGTLERKGETALGDLVADALLDKYKPLGAQIAFTNGGGLRAALPSSYTPKDGTLVRSGCSSTTACDLVVGDIYTVLPFGNICVVRKITGKLLWDVLEFSVGALPAINGRFLQIAGFKYEYSVGAAVGSRVLKVTLDGGKDIPKTDTTEYGLVTNDFTNAGGDGYTMLKETSPSPGLEVMADVLLSYVKAKTPLSPTIVGRITEKP